MDPGPGGPKHADPDPPTLVFLRGFLFSLARKAVLQAPRKIRLMEANAKGRHLKKFTFVCFLSEAQTLIHPSPIDETSFLAVVSVAPTHSQLRFILACLRYSASFRFTHEEYSPSLVQYSVPAWWTLQLY
jgi:hypothetical protein